MDLIADHCYKVLIHFMHGRPNQLPAGTYSWKNRTEEVANLVEVVINPVFLSFIVSEKRKKASFEAWKFCLN